MVITIVLFLVLLLSHPDDGRQRLPVQLLQLTGFYYSFAETLSYSKLYGLGFRVTLNSTQLVL